jgi:hypothetical protein
VNPPPSGNLSSRARDEVIYTPAKEKAKNTKVNFTYFASDGKGSPISNKGNISIALFSPYSFISRYTVLILGFVLLGVGLLISGVYTSALDKSSPVRQVIGDADIAPTKSITSIVTIDSVEDRMLIGVYPDRANITSAKPIVSLLSPKKEPVTLTPLKGPFVTEFKPSSTGNYTISVFNQGPAPITVDAFIGHLAQDQTSAISDKIQWVINGMYIVIVGLVVVVVGASFTLSEILTRANLTKDYEYT